MIAPLFLPRGDIGCLSAHGTINDLAMAGARRLYLAASFILEEGLPLKDLSRFVQMETRLGGSRIVDGLAGEHLPRI